MSTSSHDGMKSDVTMMSRATALKISSRYDMNARTTNFTQNINSKRFTNRFSAFNV